MHPSKHILAAVLVPLMLISGAASYYRFVVANDYIVEYEGECDPASESCFEGCEDDLCEETYPYKLMEKYAADLREACGPDISDCEEANICLPTDSDCEVTYCDPENLEIDEACALPEAAEEDASEEEEGTGISPEGNAPDETL